jgi:hypothetical protein
MRTLKLFFAFPLVMAGLAQIGCSGDAGSAFTSSENALTDAVGSPLTARPATSKALLTCRTDAKFEEVEVYGSASDDIGAQVFLEEFDRPRDGQGVFVRTSTSLVNFPDQVADHANGTFSISGHFVGQAAAGGNSDVTFFVDAGGTHVALSGQGPVLDQANGTLTTDGLSLRTLSCGPGGTALADVFTCELEKFEDLVLEERLDGNGQPAGLELWFAQADRPRDGQGLFTASTETLVNLPAEVATETKTEAAGQQTVVFTGKASGQAGTRLDVSLTFREQKDGSGYSLAVGGSGSVHDALIERLTQILSESLVHDIDQLRCAPASNKR